MRIADAIRAGIASGQYPPGQGLPGLRALAPAYKAGLVAVRLAARIARINAVSPVTGVQEEVTARMPARPETAQLSVPGGTPLFDVTRARHTAEEALDLARLIIRAGIAAFG